MIKSAFDLLIISRVLLCVKHMEDDVLFEVGDGFVAYSRAYSKRGALKPALQPKPIRIEK